jgi:hypothetical protein
MTVAFGKENRMLLWIHPIAQGLTAVIALYVLWLGIQRFASRHLGKSTIFEWERHVLLGKVVVSVWALGAIGGTAATYIEYGKIFTESLHFRVGIAMLAALAVTWLTGTHMDRHRNASTVLPVVHLINNVILLVLFIVQAVTGIGIVFSALLQ